MGTAALPHHHDDDEEEAAAGLDGVVVDDDGSSPSASSSLLFAGRRGCSSWWWWWWCCCSCSRLLLLPSASPLPVGVCGAQMVMRKDHHITPPTPNTNAPDGILPLGCSSRCCCPPLSRRSCSSPFSSPSSPASTTSSSPPSPPSLPPSNNDQEEELAAKCLRSCSTPWRPRRARRSRQKRGRRTAPVCVNVCGLVYIRVRCRWRQGHLNPSTDRYARRRTHRRAVPRAGRTPGPREGAPARGARSCSAPARPWGAGGRPRGRRP